MPKSIKPIILLLIWPLFPLAQVNESFEDGNFTVNPIWTGTDSLFKVNAQKQLQSDGKSSLTNGNLFCYQQANEGNLEWEFWIKLNFNPSSQNNARFYLCADSSKFLSSTQSAFLQFGGSVGNTDSITLFINHLGKVYPLVKSRPGILGKTQNTLKIKVLRKSDYTWKLFTDTSFALQNYILEGSSQDSSVLSQPFMGLWFKYTSGNAGNLFFDNLYQGPERTDTLAPQLKHARFKDASSIQLLFSEPIKAEALLSSFSNAYLDSVYVMAHEVIYRLLNPVKSKTVVGLNLLNFADLNGNLGKDTLIELLYFKPTKHDILLSELMVDPSPPISLPDAEYIEIYNASAYPCYVDQLKLLKGEKAYPFTEGNTQILPGTFLLLIKPIDSALFTDFPNNFATSLPSFTNTGDTLSLLNQEGDLLHQIAYSLSTYEDPMKNSGGYALEMKNELELCKGMLNWKASSSNTGGTPGMANSEWYLKPDSLAPQLLQVAILDSIQLYLEFNEDLKEGVVCQLNQEPTHILLNKNEIYLTLHTALQHVQTAKLSCNGISDCLNNSNQINVPLFYATPKSPGLHELLITEICFDEKLAKYLPNGEYVELFNNSNYAIRLGGFWLSDGYGKTQLPDFTLLPDSFVILCATSNERAFQSIATCIGLEHFPSLNETDQLTIANEKGYILHRVNYEGNWLKERWHHNPLAISLELANRHNPCSGMEVWLPSLSPLGGTPGKANSVQTDNKDSQKPLLQLWCRKDTNVIVLTFNEAIDSSTYQILFDGQAQSCELSYYQNKMNRLLIQSNTLHPNKEELSLTVSHIKDCAGNSLEQKTLAITSVQPATENLIQISEVLFNAYPYQYDFVELHNPSDFAISLDNLLLCRKAEQKGPWTEHISLNGPDYCLAPKQTLALHPKPESLKNTYTQTFLENTFAHPMLSMPDEGGWLLLCDSNLQTIDEMPFNESMHFSLINQSEGYSLSRLSLSSSGKETANWSSTANRASPGISSFQISRVKEETVFYANPNKISPNQDGYHDFTYFTFVGANQLEWMKLILFDWNGQMVKEFEPLLSGSELSEIRWDGLAQNNEIVSPGLYQAVLKTQNENGERKTYRCSFAVYDH